MVPTLPAVGLGWGGVGWGGVGGRECSRGKMGVGGET